MQEIHSALVLTRSERVRRAAGEGQYLDPRRALDTLPDRVFMASELAELLAHVTDTVETLTCHFEEYARSLTADMRSIDGEMEEMKNRIEAIVAAFNEAPSDERRTRMVELQQELKKERSLRRRLARFERPLSAIAFELGRLLARSRTDLFGSPHGAR